MGALWTYFFVFILYNNAVKKLLRPPPQHFVFLKKWSLNCLLEDTGPRSG